MSPISWLQWFPAFERSQKGIAECHNLIMYFWVSLHVLRLLEIFHSHYDLALCLSPVSLFCFTLSFLFLSLSFQFLPLFLICPFVHCPFCHVFNSFTPSLLSLCSLLYLSLPSPLLWFIFPLLHSFPWTGGRAAGLLHPCVRDGNHRGDVWCGPTQSWSGWPVCMPPWFPSAPTGKRASRTTTPLACPATSSASQVGTSVKQEETVHHQTTIN